MSEELVEIEVDGRVLQAPRGKMLIDVTDANGISIPRFCYHKKLSIAANCRMCLVEIERAPKPMPACATPVTPGMKVRTRSAKAVAAQKGTMEFLLINHPLDCPICDQGGECELQDLAMGYGQSQSQYVELKRVVPDPDLGALIATEMTRCIHCTRCVRFGEEIAGVRELGATGRGEFVRIGTYVARTVDSELSGNVIDLCPVGALTAKPSRYAARAWEMLQTASVAPHDAVGSNCYLHTSRGKVVRVVPRENEAINEVWLSDRDRFSYEGIYASDRVERPLLKVEGVWREVEWPVAVAAAAEALGRVRDNYGGDKLGALIAPTTTLEEQYLAQKLVRALGSNNIDHRLRQLDFSDQQQAPAMPWLGNSLAALEQLGAVLFVDADPRRQQPLANHRVRKAALRGASVNFVNPTRLEMNYPVGDQCVADPAGMVADLASVLLAAAGKSKVPEPLAALVAGAKAGAAHKRIAKQLKSAERAMVVLGAGAVGNPYLAQLRALAAAIAEASGAGFGYLPESGNSAGAWLSGCLPHRGVAGAPCEPAGADALAMLQHPLKGYLLMGLDPEWDCADPQTTLRALRAADTVVALSSFATEALREVAQVILPMATFAETSGTFVNAEGLWQSFRGAAVPVAESRPGWKILRVLGNELALTGFDQLTSEAVRDEVKVRCAELRLDNTHPQATALQAPDAPAGLRRYGSVAPYAGDALVRRAAPLQRTRLGARPVLGLAPATAARLGLAEGQRALVRQEEAQTLLSVRIDEALPEELAWLPPAAPGSEALGSAWGTVVVEAAADGGDA